MKTKTDETIFIQKNTTLADGTIFPGLYSKKLLELDGVRHVFTTRAGGVSTGIYESLNLSFTRGDERDHVMENYRRVAESLGISIDQMVTSDQTHTTNVRRVTKEDMGKGITRERDYTDVDGMITDESGICLATFYADCVPLFLADPVHHAIGLSHSGWRGTVGRMGSKTLLAMKEAFGTAPSDVICAIGPSICQDCYEVSGDVAEPFADTFRGHENEILYKKDNGKYQLNLWRANELVLLDAGVKADHIDVTNICTCCNAKELFSHRATGGRRGNLGAFFMLEEIV